MLAIDAADRSFNLCSFAYRYAVAAKVSCLGGGGGIKSEDQKEGVRLCFWTRKGQSSGLRLALSFVIG